MIDPYCRKLGCRKPGEGYASAAAQGKLGHRKSGQSDVTAICGDRLDEPSFWEDLFEEIFSKLTSLFSRIIP